MKRVFRFLAALLCLVVIGFLCTSAVHAEDTASVNASSLSDEGNAFVALTDEGEFIFFRSYKPHFGTSFMLEMEDTHGYVYRGKCYCVEEDTIVTTWPEWHFQAEAIKKVRIADGYVIRPKSTAHWFAYCGNLESVDLSNLDTSECVVMKNMFEKCRSLKSIDLSGFDTSNATDTSNMFNDCRIVTELDVRHFKTSNVTDMSGMFSGCDSLEHVDVSNFETSEVTNMSGMFGGCDNLEHIDVSNFDTSKVTDMSAMFAGLQKLEQLDVSNFDTSNTNNFSKMFSWCKNISELNLNSFNTEQATDMNGMFECCFKLKNLDLSSFSTPNVTNMDYMFYGAGFGDDMGILDIRNFDTSHVDTMREMFPSMKYKKVYLGKKFTVWKDESYFFVGNWKNSAAGIELDATDLYTQYPAHAAEWAGLWEKAIDLPKSVKISKSELILSIGEGSIISGSVQPYYADDRSCTYTSSNPSIATVSREGFVRAISAGTATITATTVNGLTDTCTVLVLFDDVPAESKYYSAPVYWAVGKGITNGYKESNGIVRTFKPQNNCTREAVVTFLWRLAGKPEPTSMKSKFKDVQDKSKYYYKAVLWAAEKGITGGYSDGTFKPSATCLREHVVTFLWRYAGKPDPGVSKNPFNDVKSSDYYYNAALWANAKGIAKGYTSGEHAGGFGPKLDCLREHVVTFLYRYAK